MTVATLFTPKITPQFDVAPIDTASTDASSAETGWDSYALDTDVADESDEVAHDNDMAEPLSSNQLLPTETAYTFIDLVTDKIKEPELTAEWEKQLSSTFIHTEHYGTRVSNLLLLSDTQLQWQEKQQSGQHQGAIEQISLELHSSAATDADRSSVNR